MLWYTLLIYDIHTYTHINLYYRQTEAIGCQGRIWGFDRSHVSECFCTRWPWNTPSSLAIKAGMVLDHLNQIYSFPSISIQGYGQSDHRQRPGVGKHHWDIGFKKSEITLWGLFSLEKPMQIGRFLGEAGTGWHVAKSTAIDFLNVFFSLALAYYSRDGPIMHHVEGRNIDCMPDGVGFEPSIIKSIINVSSILFRLGTVFS